MKQPAPKVKDPEWPWKLPGLTTPDIVALQALEQGVADQHQQRHAWQVIRETLCGCERMTFWPGGLEGERATSFAEGKRWVAAQLRRISRLKPSGVDTRDDPPAMPAGKSE